MIFTTDSSIMYQQWTYTTACCFKYKTKCELCPNEIVCSKFTKPVGDYYIHPIKYATLKTYANIGLEGYKKAFISQNKTDYYKDEEE